jgi:hypothetical protein
MDDREAVQEGPAGVQTRAEHLSDGEVHTAELEKALAALREELHRAHIARREAVQRYRAALLAQSPELPAELVTGDTVEEVEAAVQRTRELVDRVREQLAMDTGRVVPAGSPPRRPPDLDALSPAEKIRLGLATRQ